MTAFREFFPGASSSLDSIPLVLSVPALQREPPRPLDLPPLHQAPHGRRRNAVAGRDQASGNADAVKLRDLPLLRLAQNPRWLLLHSHPREREPGALDAADRPAVRGEVVERGRDLDARVPVVVPDGDAARAEELPDEDRVGEDAGGGVVAVDERRVDRFEVELVEAGRAE